jgi:hypothetical protein
MSWRLSLGTTDLPFILYLQMTQVPWKVPGGAHYCAALDCSRIIIFLSLKRTKYIVIFKSRELSKPRRSKLVSSMASEQGHTHNHNDYAVG